MGGETAVDRVAIVGCGAAGAAHAGTVARCGRTELVSCCDVVPARSTTLSTRHGGRACTDLAGVLGERPDIVIVATGPLAQPDVVDELVALGFRGGLLCEKPLATGVVRARALVRRAEEIGVAVAVNQQRRFGRAAEVAHAMIREGAVGELRRLEGYAPDATVFDWGPHVVDMAVQLAEESPVTWVHARLDTTTTRRHAGLVLEGGGTMVWEHDGGVSGRLISGSPAAGQPLFRVVGSAGTLELGGLSGKSGERDGHRTALRASTKLTGGWRDIEVGESVLPSALWLRSLDEVVRARRDRRRPAHDVGRGVMALEVCLAGYLSASTGAPRTLPLDQDVDIRNLVPTGVGA